MDFYQRVFHPVGRDPAAITSEAVIVQLRYKPLLIAFSYLGHKQQELRSLYYWKRPPCPSVVSRA